ncbi:MAG TPA: Rad52/Rad22 family DNA repair protein [Ktedonobacterales bacterium]
MGEMQSPTREEWDEIARRLQEPFDPAEVDFRVQGKPNEASGRAQVVAYIDARAVQDRLDKVVGPLNWSFDWAPLVIEQGEVMVAKGTLTVLGVSKSDAGSASNFEQTLGAVSHCFKRAAVHWGVGRYLYSLPMTWVQVERNGRIPAEILRDLRARLPRSEHTARANSGSATSGSPVYQLGQEPATVAEAPAPALTTRPPASKAATTRTPARPAAERPEPAEPARATLGSAEAAATDQQMRSIRKLCQALGQTEPADSLSNAQARELISQLSSDYQRMRRAS